MNTPDSRLEDLFVRYWDNTLTDAEGAELERLLSSDPAAREWFRTLSLQAVTSAELASVHGLVEAAKRESEPAGPARRGWSRRRALRYVGGGIAASVAATLGELRIWGDSGPPQARMGAVRGDVKIATASGPLTARNGRLVPAGATVSTVGMDSSVALVCPDGTGVSLAGDSALIVSEGGMKMMLVRGYATADIRPKPDVRPLELMTAVASITTPTGALLTLGHAIRATEIVVEDGAVNVFDQADEKLAVVGAGEMFTVQTGGVRKKRATPVTPDSYTLPIDQPLPDDWHVGKRRDTAHGPVLVPEWWHDPYHGTEMWQIRSDKEWARGFFRLFPDSTLHVRYWVDKPGPGQVIACVRAARLPDAETGVVAANGAFENAVPKQWTVLSIRASDLLDNVHAPKFAAPWVGFLLIFNTYKADLGLKIAEYRVTRPGTA
ncbi:MAG TPA: hypothetical protein VMZ71_00010 [Gemmataceae bacterium]|nr:hypothetical protein [Gemmataceae bacterium]